MWIEASRGAQVRRQRFDGSCIRSVAKVYAMLNLREISLNPELHLRDGRIIRSFADALMLVREHEARPGIDHRDEVLHQLERARNKTERQRAVEAFFAWARELDLIAKSRPVASQG